MNAIQFIKDHGVEKAREVVGKNHECYMPEVFKYWSEQLHDFVLAPKYASCLVADLKRLVESVDLINSVGGLTIAKKITFQKRLRNEKATHFIQHPENQKLIQFFVRNQSKPEAAIKFDLFEQAIADYESIYGGEHV